MDRRLGVGTIVGWGIGTTVGRAWGPGCVGCCDISGLGVKTAVGSALGFYSMVIGTTVGWGVGTGVGWVLELQQ